MDGQVSTLLVVDDDPSIVHMLSQRLTASGYRVLTAGSGHEALALIEGRPVDLAISDINMPGMDGFDLLSAIRERRNTGQLPVIMLTARDQASDVIKALRLGANDYATKPMRFEELERRIEAHLALKAVEGQVVRGYQLVRRVGAGATGVICEAVEIATSRSVALKVLRRSYSADSLLVGRFLREAELAARVEHPNVVRTIKAGADGLTHYIVMELVRGFDLAALVVNRPLELSAALGITRQIVLALQAMAGVGVTHRDIKPENVLITAEGTVKVTDFGIAHDMWRPDRITRTGYGVGTPAYASPQQLRGDPDLATDVYGLGCTLFFMLTSRDPFDTGQPFEALMRDKTRSARRVTVHAPELPREVCRLLEAMIDPSSARRPAVAEVQEAIDALLAGEPLPLANRGLARLLPWRR